MSVGSIRAAIGGVAAFFPEARLSNEQLAAELDDWSAERILEKTGIESRFIAADDETAGDLAFGAATRLFAKYDIDPASIDFILLCSQAPDYVLPSTSCVLQTRLGIPTHAGSLDFNLGCSGFVYGLSLAKGLIETGSARRVLLLTADTYSKYINPRDKSVRTLFGDAACATLVEAREGTPDAIGPFVFGTDGRGAKSLIVPAGGFRKSHTAQSAVASEDGSGNWRSEDDLYMDGAAVMAFSLTAVPAAVASLSERTGRSLADYDHIVLHQAKKFMLNALVRKLKVSPEKMPMHFAHCGNTVSSTIPIVLENLLDSGRLTAGTRAMLVGFGVGLSWAACSVTF